LSKPNLLVIAAVILWEGRLMLARRAAHKSLAGYWELPGGKVEAGEDERECLRRELKEELELDAEISDLVAENTHEYETGAVKLRAYIANPRELQLVLRDHDAVAWITREEAANYKIAPADIPLLEPIWKTTDVAAGSGS
jgi:8-oxo-dGTP diphosphatase